MNPDQPMGDFAVILAARMGSRRLPGKVMRPLAGMPLLSHGIHRLQRIGPVIVATTDLAEDDVVENLARSERAYCFRGSQQDVLDRYYGAAKAFGLSYIVRATGDNPFVDPQEASRVADHLLKHAVDYVTGIEVVDHFGLPVGVGVEGFTREALRRSWLEARAPGQREHINEYVLDNVDLFTIFRMKCLEENSCPELRLTVDTVADFEFTSRILEGVAKGPMEITTRDIIAWWKKSRS